MQADSRISRTELRKVLFFPNRQILVECRSFLGALLVSFALVGIAKPCKLAEPGAARSVENLGDATIVVCPTNAHPDDVTDIQWALDKGVPPATGRCPGSCGPTSP